MADPRPLNSPLEGLSPVQAAQEAGLHKQTIYRWIRDGILPVTRFGRTKIPRIRIHPDDLADAVRGVPSSSTDSDAQAS